MISLTWAVESSLAEMGSDDFVATLTLSREDVMSHFRTLHRARTSWTDLRRPLLLGLAQLAHEAACVFDFASPYYMQRQGPSLCRGLATRTYSSGAVCVQPCCYC